MVSASPTRAVNSLLEHTASETKIMIEVTTGFPWVSVPVLSKIIVLT